jgi:hypothetical protein
VRARGAGVAVRGSGRGGGRADGTGGERSYRCHPQWRSPPGGVFIFADRDIATSYEGIVDGIHTFSLRPGHRTDSRHP